MTDADTQTAYAVLRSIRRIVRHVQDHSRRLSREAGLTVPQLLCLRAIDHHDGPITVAQLSAAVQLSASTVSGVLDRLERADLVRRERDTVDRRRVFLVLTEAGQARVVDLPTPLHVSFLGRLGDLDPADRQELVEALDRVVALMGAEGVDASPVLTDEVDPTTPVR